MNKLFNTKNIFKLLAVLFIAITVVSCQRDGSAEEDDIPQEELTNVVLLVTEDTPGAITNSYNYSIGAGGTQTIPLVDGKSYNVEVKFKNGNEDVTQEIIDAKDEHFLIFDFPKSNISITREDTSASTGALGKVGLLTKWNVVKVVNSSAPFLKLDLIHAPQSASPAQNGTAWGSVVGGETDAEATFNLSN
ncbi:hypothetical protein SAMN05421841_0221 [Chryseobacterium wanjuense]|jgi:hypothetical protein|uniref:Uncharacterized protein n=1 Tax=Chryseobacterium wanjuense TaxID=356305 RepID=A0A1I0MW00_9FLAO|nr:hypothetical protein [Chryseobacterium wanjuense]SEV92526.1 hypothetical protein SAMN05421841_0221 [Chryseobacterium wanjuense]